MKTVATWKFSFWAMALAMLVGCATTRVDWNARIGHFTFDQAVIELGPPDKQQKLSDGRNVAEWITRIQNTGNIAISSGFYNRGGVGIIQSTGPSYYERKLRLTFGTDNVLTAWSKN